MSIRTAREHSSDPVSPVFNRYLQELAQVRNTQKVVTDPDSQRVSIPSRSRLKYYDCFNQQQVDPATKVFKYPLEPDFNDLTIWLRMDHTGNLVKDYSCFDNHAKVVGDPRLVEGLSYGQFGGNIALQMDGENDYLYIPEGVNGAGRITNLTTGFSILSVIYPQSLHSIIGPQPTLVQKIDDNSNDYGYVSKILDDGRLLFAVKVDGEESIKETVATPFADPAGTIHDYFEDDFDAVDFDVGPLNYTLVPNWYLIWLRSDMAEAPNLSVYINNTPMTLQDSSYDSGLPSVDIHDTIVGAGTGGTKGHFPGIYQDYRFMKRQVTPTEISNHWTNKLSISNIAYGEIFTVGGVVFN